MIAKLPKWFYASFRKYIEDSLEDYSLYFSGDRANPNATIDVVIIGPTIEAIGKDQYYVEMMTNLVIKIPVEEDKEYYLHKIAGTCIDTMLAGVTIYKYGDDGSKLDCMRVPNSRKRQVRYVHHGIVEPNTELIQATVNAKHELTLNLGA